jgi:hypothetical protein
MPIANAIPFRRGRVFAIVLSLLSPMGTPRAADAQSPTVSIYVGTTGTNSVGRARESGLSVTLTPEAFFRITVSAGHFEPFTLRYTISGSATPEVDYQTLTGTLEVPASATRQSFLLPLDVLNDGVTERGETVVLRLAKNGGYAIDITHETVTFTIIDVDQKIQLSTLAADAAEPGTKRGSIKIERLGTLQGARKVAMSYAGTATRGVDYAALPDTGVFPDGQDNVVLEIVPLPDAAAEGPETVQISAVGALGNPRIITIADAAVTVATSVSSLTEVAGNTANFVYTRTGDLAQSTTVAYRISGTAANATDYNLIPSQAVFAAGSNTATVPIVVRAGNVAEGAETITLTISSSASVAAGSPNSATLVIADNVAPSVAAMTLSPASVAGGAASAGQLEHGVSGATHVDDSRGLSGCERLGCADTGGHQRCGLFGRQLRASRRHDAADPVGANAFILRAQFDHRHRWWIGDRQHRSAGERTGRRVRGDRDNEFAIRRHGAAHGDGRGGHQRCVAHRRDARGHHANGGHNHRVGGDHEPIAIVDDQPVGASSAYLLHCARAPYGAAQRGATAY